MHEMSLAEGIIQLIEDAARDQAFASARVVWLEIGRLSSVETESLRFCFDVVSRGTLADSARLEIIDVPGRAWCLSCSQSVDLPSLYEACPQCGGYQVQVTSGTEMRVKELEVD